MFISIAISLLFENSEITVRECVSLYDSLISAALGLGKDVEEGKSFSMKHKTLTVTCHTLTTTCHALTYFIGDPEPLIHINSSGAWYVYLLTSQLSSLEEGPPSRKSSLCSQSYVGVEGKTKKQMGKRYQELQVNRKWDNSVTQASSSKQGFFCIQCLFCPGRTSHLLIQNCKIQVPNVCVPRS